LGQTPIEGSRRQGYYTVAKDYVGDTDPFKGSDAPVIDRDAETFPAGVNTYDEYVDYLYENHFEVIVRDDVDDENFFFKWYNEYYFFGIYQDLLDSAPYLEQTTGWGGAFNPVQ
jgi:hypothetical protein